MFGNIYNSDPDVDPKDLEDCQSLDESSLPTPTGLDDMAGTLDRFQPR